MRLTPDRLTAIWWASAAAVAYSIVTFEWEWAVAALAVHFIVATIFSAVTHRYFCHRAYLGNPKGMWLLSFVPVMYGWATPKAWAYMHAAHHAYSDTERDININHWTSLVRIQYRMPPAKFALAGRWFRHARHDWLHTNAALVMLAWAGLLLAVSVKAFVWLFAVPLFTLNLAHCLHVVIAHNLSGAANRWYLEYVLPMGGEWIHDRHHVNQVDPFFKKRWYEFDPGGLLVKLLSR